MLNLCTFLKVIEFSFATFIYSFTFFFLVYLMRMTIPSFNGQNEGMTNVLCKLRGWEWIIQEGKKMIDGRFVTFC